jgi:hypothetical protein
MVVQFLLMLSMVMVIVETVVVEDKERIERCQKKINKVM